jgi:hypothetical protein
MRAIVALALCISGCGSAMNPPAVPTVVQATPASVLIDANASEPPQAIGNLAQAECRKHGRDAAVRGSWNRSALLRQWLFYCVPAAGAAPRRS